MAKNNLKAISPLDGRYQKRIQDLGNYCSEFGLMKYRLRVEVEYFIALYEFGIFKVKNTESLYKLRELYLNFTEEDALEIKEIESTTNHDVKAIEYFIKNNIKGSDLEENSEWIHFALTSQDINNTAIPLYWKEAINEIYEPLFTSVLTVLNQKAAEWKSTPFLTRTHGQAATPSTLGKEIKVFAYRLEKQWEAFKELPHTGKFGGATGGLNAHYIAFPNKDWDTFSKNFLKNHLGLERQEFTTQIENYDFLSAQFQNLSRINTILLDFVRDMWTYISQGYFKQLIIKDEVGSSAMPHKVNPIDFENAEGNIGIANAIWAHFSEKLPISRLQRDLSDSTVLRNLGVPLGHSLIALNSIVRGLNRIDINKEKIEKVLNDNWAIVAEAIQTILRREQFPKPYEALKDLTRSGNKITKELLHDFILNLDIKEEIKNELLEISPFNFIGNTDKF